MAKRYYLFNSYPAEAFNSGGIMHAYFTSDASTRVTVERVDVSWYLAALQTTFYLGLNRYPDMATAESDDTGMLTPIAYDGGWENSDSIIQALDPNSGPCVTTIIPSQGGLRPWQGPWAWSPSREDTLKVFDISEFGGFTVQGGELLRVSLSMQAPVTVADYRLGIFFSEETIG